MFNEKEKLQKEQELKDRTYIPCKMKDAQGLKRVEVVGDIFKIEERDIKKVGEQLKKVYEDVLKLK